MTVRRSRAKRLPILLALLPLAAAAAAPGVEAIKRQALASVDRQAPELISLSDRIWSFAETALRERRSAALLADYAEAQGFRVERGVADMPTAFVASYGSGRPVIGVLGEYDALPGLSQQAEPHQAPLEEGAAGHGCGHNLFGPASLGAAVAIKQRIEAGELEGTVRFYGTPAEEDVGGKVYMLRAGLFDDLDVALAWHPDDETSADTGGSQAMVDFAVEFRGRAAHAAYDPWNGRSALDGAELFTHALNLMREHVPPTARIHYVVPDGGRVPNVVPADARVWVWMRDSEHGAVDGMLERARAAARGAALATGTESTLRVQSGGYEMLVNLEGARLLHENLSWLGPLEFSPEEQDFARELQQSAGVEAVGLAGEVQPLELEPGPPDGGSTDVADVSWRVPTLHLTVATAPHGSPWHAWPVVASSGMAIGHRGMLYAARALAATMVDLFADEERRERVIAEFREKTADAELRLYIPDGPPPVPAD